MRGDGPTCGSSRVDLHRPEPCGIMIVELDFCANPCKVANVQEVLAGCRAQSKARRGAQEDVKEQALWRELLVSLRIERIHQFHVTSLP